MIEVLEESQGRILGVRARGKVTDQDYKEILVPRLEAIIKEFGQARLLFFMGEDFAGYTAGAMWDDARFGLRHKDDFDKVAVVGGVKWIEWAVKLFARLMKGEVKTYSPEQLAEAWAWIRT